MPTIQRPSRAMMSRILPTVLLCGFGFCGARAGDTSPATNPPAVQQVDVATKRIEMSEATSMVLEYPDWLTTVKSLDPSVIRVSAIRPNRLRVERVSQGTATLHAVDRGDRQYSIEVIVRAPAAGR